MKIALVALALFGAVLPSASFAADAAAGPGNDLLCTQWGCVGGSTLFSFSGFHGVPDGDFPSNFGASLALELASPIPGLQDYGLGVQASGSYGQFDLNGHPASAHTSMLREHFYSLGAFRRPNLDGAWYSRFGAGFVYDIAILNNFGIPSDQVYVRQLRLKGSYSISERHEVGVWTAVGGPTASGEFTNLLTGLPDQYRASGQLDFYYKHRFEQGGHVMVYYGPGVGGHLPTLDTTNGLPGIPYYGLKWTVGGEAEAPLNDYLAVYAAMAWGDPDVASGVRSFPADDTQSWNVTAGLRFFWGGNARGRDDGGKRWTPYLPAADNGNFMIHSNYVE